MAIAFFDSFSLSNFRTFQVKSLATWTDNTSVRRHIHRFWCTWSFSIRGCFSVHPLPQGAVLSEEYFFFKGLPGNSGSAIVQ